MPEPSVSRRRWLTAAGWLAGAAAAGGSGLRGSAVAQAQTGAADSLIGALRAARVIDLSFTWNDQAPVLSLNPPYSFALNRTHKMTHEIFGQVPGSRVSWASELMFFSGQHGAPTIDALGHISDNMKMFGGADAAASEGASGLLTLGIEAYPKERLINRAVLLDVARFKKVEALAPGQEISAQDLEATARAQGVEIRAGDSVLIRTGYGKYFETDKAKYAGWRPGPDESAARWLAGKKVFLAGDDQMSFEVVPEKGTVFPCHRILIADNGIYIVENLNLEELSRVLADQKVYEFVLVLNPPRIRGATGAAVNAFALLP